MNWIVPINVKILQGLPADESSPLCTTEHHIMLFCSGILYSFFSFVLSFYFNKMKIELGSKLCELFLSTFAEFSTGCMHPADPLFVNFGSLIAAMEMWSKIMIFSCDKWSSQGRNQHLFLNLLWEKKVYYPCACYLLFRQLQLEQGFSVCSSNIAGSLRRQSHTTGRSEGKTSSFKSQELMEFQSGSDH